jgi:hypothetical protein
MPRVISALIQTAIFIAALAPCMFATARADEPAGQPKWPHIRIDEAQAADAGIKKLSSRRLVLYTDLPLDAEVRGLPGVFDQAFTQWCRYFHVDEAEHADWRVTAFIMKDKARFVKTGLLPPDLPPFLHGYTRHDTLWVYEQPSEYYRRHLLLHEGTHSFMFTIFGGCGPTWYMEGIAELLGTHRLRDGRLTLNYMPANRDEVPEWGRIRIVKDAVAAHRPMSVAGIVGYSGAAYLKTEPYAWSWALVALLDRHPQYRDRFRQLYKAIPQRQVTEQFLKLFQPDWRELNEQWQVYIAGMEYGCDIPRTAIDFALGQAMTSQDAAVKVAAAAGWQNSGLRLEAGASYRLTASGRYQVAKTTKIWWCEPGGVSIRYYRGRPLGILLAAVRPDVAADDAPSPLLQPTVVGLGATLLPPQSGTLFLKINHSVGELDDNAGELKVEIRQQAEK